MNDVLKRALEYKGYEALLEPTIPTEAGIRRPDLVAWKGNDAWVIDTSVTADAHGANMSLAYQRKCSNYNTQDIMRCVTERTGLHRITVAALVMNWRGDLCARSLSLLRQLGVVSSIKLLEVRNFEGSAKILRSFRAASGRWR